jgi:hypothetical protein
MAGNTWIFLLLFIVVVILINVGLISMLRSKQNHKQIGMFQKFFQDVRNPYKKEDEMLSELAKRVENLKRETEMKPTEKDDAE